MIKQCIVCGREFETSGRWLVCSGYCQAERCRQRNALRVSKHRERARQDAMRQVVLAFIADYAEYGIEFVLEHYKLARYNKSNNLNKEINAGK